MAGDLRQWVQAGLCRSLRFCAHASVSHETVTVILQGELGTGFEVSRMKMRETSVTSGYRHHRGDGFCDSFVDSFR